VIDKTFVSAYGIFAVVTWSMLLVILGWKLDRRYSRPVLYGVIFGAGSQLLFGVGVLGLILGGVLTGYMVSAFVGTGLSQFRSGSLTGLIIDSSFLLAMSIYLAAEQPEITGTLAQLCTTTLVFLFRDLMLAGLGGMLGGALRKFMTPRPA